MMRNFKGILMLSFLTAALVQAEEPKGWPVTSSGRFQILSMGSEFTFMIDSEGGQVWRRVCSGNKCRWDAEWVEGKTKGEKPALNINDLAQPE